MIKLILISIFISIFFEVQSQNSEVIKNSFGITLGNNHNSIGVVGLFYNLKTRQNIELKTGIGVRDGCVFGLGMSYPIVSRNWLKFLLSLDYSYHGSTYALRGYRNNEEDKYFIKRTTYVHSYLITRFSLSNSESLQIKFGYTSLITGGSFVHKEGPDRSSSRMSKILNSGLLIGVSYIISFSPDE